MDAIVLDLDGTLLRGDKTLSRFSQQTLEEVRARGHMLVFATARPPRAVRAVLPEVFWSEFLVCYNGALVLRDGRTVMERAIPASDVIRIMEHLEAALPTAARGYEYADQLYVMGSFARHFPAEFCTDLPAGRPCLTSSPKLLVDLLDGADFAQLAAALPASCYAIRTDGGGLCQIMPTGATKERGVAWVLGELGLGFEQVVCFGDDHNDEPLFRRAGCAVAMGNAVPELKALAHFVAGTNEEDGVAQFLARRYLGSEDVVRGASYAAGS